MSPASSPTTSPFASWPLGAQVDVDELWTPAQLVSLVRLLTLSSPSPHWAGRSRCAYMDCHFFVSPHLLTVTPDGYGHSSQYEWLRAWLLPAHTVRPQLCLSHPSTYKDEAASVTRDPNS